MILSVPFQRYIFCFPQYSPLVFTNLQDNQFAKTITANSWIVHLTL